jgi:hypothetical protein
MDLEVFFVIRGLQIDAWIWRQKIDLFSKLQLEQLLEEHRKGMVVRTRLSYHHDLCPILSCWPAAGQVPWRQQEHGSVVYLLAAARRAGEGRGE